MKAFLSHSSSDAEFVHAVAEELGRQFVWLDEHVFATGDDFVAGMEAGVGESVIFVLFANRTALQSINVQFEIFGSSPSRHCKAHRSGDGIHH